MGEISITLLSDGSSDKRLLPVIIWLLHQHRPDWAVQSNWADLRGLSMSSLSDKILRCLECYPCDLLFIHRDAENELPALRKGEIMAAVEGIVAAVETPPVICVIPVKMQEAWLLFDEIAIRKAAGNPNGDILLELPDLSTVETLPDPKALLYDLIKAASELRARRLKKLRVSKISHLVAEYIENFSPLRRLPAFNTFENELTNFISTRQ